MRVQWIVSGLLLLLALLFVWFTEGVATEVRPAQAIEAEEFARAGDDVLAAEGDHDEESAEQAAAAAAAAEEEARAAESRRKAERSAQGAREAVREVRVRGRVLDLEEKPVGDAQVLFARRRGRSEAPLDSLAFLASAEVQSVWTSAEGTFELKLRGPGAIRLGLRHAGHAPFDTDALFVPDERSHDLGDFTLLPGLLLRGLVRDPSGEPLEGIRMELTAPEHPVHAGTTNEKGEFAVATVAPGAWRLEFESPRYPHVLASGVDAEPGTVIDLEVQFEEGCTRPIYVSGLDSYDPPPWVRATPVGSDREPREVQLDPFRSGGQPTPGVYAFEVPGLLPDLEYAFQVREHSEPDAWLTFARRATCSREEPVSFELPERGSLAFEVINDVTEQPVSEFEVTIATRAEMSMEAGATKAEFTADGRRERGAIRKHWIRASTEEGLTRDGAKWVVRSVPNTVLIPQIELEFRAEGYRVHRWKPSRIGPNIVNDIGVVRMTPMARLDVLVLDEEGRPLSDALVHAELHTNYLPPSLLDAFVSNYPPKRTARFTNRRGEVRLPAARASSFTVWAEHPAYAIPWPAQAFSHLDETIEFRMTPGGSVAIRVRNQAKIPMKGWEVSHEELMPPMHPRREHPRRGSLVTDADGTCLFEHLTEGNHVLKVRHPDQQVPATETVVTVYEGMTLEFDLVVPEVFDLTGVVSTEDVTLPGAKVTIHAVPDDGVLGGTWTPSSWSPGGRGAGPLEGFAHSVFTDALGRYRFSGLPLGSFHVDVAHPRRALPTRFELDVELEGEYQRDFELPASRIVGHVFDDEGGPVADAQVAVHPGPEADALRAHDEDRGLTADYARGHQATTDEFGRFELSGLPLDLPLVVEAWAVRYAATWSSAIRLHEDAPEASLSLTLEPDSSILVVVTENEVPVGSHPVVLSRSRGTRRSATTDEWGRLYFGPLVPGTWTVFLRSDRTISVDLGPGRTEVVRFEL